MIGLMEGRDDVQSALLTNPDAPAPPLCGGPLEAKRSIGSGNARSPLFQNQSRDSCSLGVDDWKVDEGSFFTLSCPSLPPPASLIKKLGAEFIGTFILIFAGTATATVNQPTNLVGLAASNGLAVMVVILSTGHISGAHLNPAVTIAFAALRRFPWKQVPMYIGAQVVAAVWAAFATTTIFQPGIGRGLTVPTGSHVQAFALEFIITFILMFVITAATDSLAVGELAGIAGGATVMLNVLIAGEITGASMNPVRTLGPAIVANNFRAIWVYLTAPILGALCGAGAYTAVKLREEIGFKTSPKGYK